MIAKSKVIGTIFVTTGLAVAVPSLAAAAYATKSEFVAAVAGKTITTTTKSGKTMTAVYDSKGGGISTLDDGKPAKFTWTFKGDTLCSTFKSLSFTECNKVEIASPSEVHFIDSNSGNLNNIYSVK